MGKKQTAVQWLIEQLTYNNGLGVLHPSHSEFADLSQIFEQALQMEREQIEEASFNGVKIGVMNCSYDKIENIIECDYSFAQKECSEYYTQTFKP